MLKGKMNGGGGGTAKAEKTSKVKSKPAKEKKLTLKERDEQLAAAKGLAKLDVVSKPLKASARREMFRNQRKGK
jgi:hypothetical protein